MVWIAPSDALGAGNPFPTMLAPCGTAKSGGAYVAIPANWAGISSSTPKDLFAWLTPVETPPTDPR